MGEELVGPGDRLAEARGYGDPARIAVALARRGCAELTAGRLDPAWPAAVVEAARLVDGLTEVHPAGRLSAALWLGRWEIRLDRYVDAARHLEQGLAVAMTTGQEQLAPALRAELGAAYIALGRLAEAIDCLADAADGARAIDDPELAAAALSRRSWAEAWCGNLDAATAYARRAGRNGGRTARRELGLIDHLSGDSAGCAQRLTSADGQELSTIDITERICWYELLAEAGAVSNRPEHAAAWANQAKAIAQTLPLPGKRAFALLAEAWAGAHLAPEPAAGQAEVAAALFAQVGDRLGQARALLLAGQCRADERLLTSAEQLFAECGAQARRPGVLRPTDALTERELMVALLVAAGHSNREVGARLFLSLRTVEDVLARVYTKLGLGGRRENPGPR
jgi:ATP/maltotriose-dependent transcriptional regulator MalT